MPGLSPMIAHDLCHRAGSDADKPAHSLDTVELEKLWNAFASVTQQVKSQQFTPVILYENGSPREYACIPLTNYAPKQQKNCVSVSELLHTYYHEKKYDLPYPAEIFRSASYRTDCTGKK